VQDQRPKTWSRAILMDMATLSELRSDPGEISSMLQEAMQNRTKRRSRNRGLSKVERLGFRAYPSCKSTLAPMHFCIQYLFSTQYAHSALRYSKLGVMSSFNSYLALSPTLQSSSSYSPTESSYKAALIPKSQCTSSYIIVKPDVAQKFVSQATPKPEGLFAWSLK